MLAICLKILEAIGRFQIDVFDLGVAHLNEVNMFGELSALQELFV